MPDTSRKLADILALIDAATPETRHTHHAALSDAIHMLESRGAPVPRQARDLAEELLAELVEARFDNLPV